MAEHLSFKSINGALSQKVESAFLLFDAVFYQDRASFVTIFATINRYIHN